MKNFILIAGLVLSMNSYAEDSLAVQLEKEGFSQNDVEVITSIIRENEKRSVDSAKIIMDRDTGRSKMKKGTVKFFNESKGFGLILIESGEFLEFQSTVLMNVGELVTYEVQEGKKGLNAVNVKLARSIGDTRKSILSLIR